MKKVYISVPYIGNSKEVIVKKLDKMHKIAEIVFDQELEPIFCVEVEYLDTLYDETKPEDIDTVTILRYVATHLFDMTEADFFIGVEDYMYDNLTCPLESHMAEKLNLRQYYVRMDRGYDNWLITKQLEEPKSIKKPF